MTDLDVSDALAQSKVDELVDDGQAKRPHVWYDAIDIDLANPVMGSVVEA